ncbi:hypothetical protein [Paenibacillus hamazuiensis]|uniref:hypothetical protein n=1 Tax=Paenibacillus hamazuiensis TaxID=2936508 RepID=UPI00200E6740|nr:hypothetical protein [Paenibacillus hamazuiensis]
MFTQYFGHYLLNRGWVGPSALQKALEQMQITHVKLGVLSVNAGYMTAAQAEEVHRQQMKTDRRFGEIAVGLGYMTEEQLQSLLSAQKESHLLLGQALIDQEALNLEQFSEALKQFKTDYFLSDEQFSAVQNGDIDALVSAVLQADPSMNTSAYAPYLTLFIKNMIRFIEPQVFMEMNRIPAGYECEWLVSQEVTGPIRLTTGFSLKTDILLHVASRFAEEPVEAADELALASVGEFLNLHNGLFLINMSEQGIELGLTPQKVMEQAPLPDLQSTCFITVYLPAGSFELIVSVPA